jgi:outer membrane protein assembly factor BamB
MHEPMKRAGELLWRYLRSEDAIGDGTSDAARPLQSDMDHWPLRGFQFADVVPRCPAPHTGIVPRSFLGVPAVDVKWKVTLGMCIDASPLICAYRCDDCSMETSSTRDEEKFVAYVGSHAGIFAAVDVSSGNVLNSVLLGGRIEATAVADHVRQVLYVGCYDGGLYQIPILSSREQSMQPRGVFFTGDVVKSSALVDPQTGRVWVASYDHHLYCVDYNHSNTDNAPSESSASLHSSSSARRVTVSSKPLFVIWIWMVHLGTPS